MKKCPAANKKLAIVVVDLVIKVLCNKFNLYISVVWCKHAQPSPIFNRWLSWLDRIRRMVFLKLKSSLTKSKNKIYVEISTKNRRIYDKKNVEQRNRNFGKSHFIFQTVIKTLLRFDQSRCFFIFHISFSATC